MDNIVLITGGSGFLGSHLAFFFLDQGYSVISTKRASSNLWRCTEYTDRIDWINVDMVGWQQLIIDKKPALIIHAAWDGVTADQRDDLSYQLRNLSFLSEILIIARQCGTKRFIGLGSQAEYGTLSMPAHEEQDLFAKSSYGIVKIVASKLVEQFCKANEIKWYWLRVFSVFGEKESSDWFISSMINQLLNCSKEVLLTEGTQKYAYMYIQDFAKNTFLLASKKQAPAEGVYNISGSIAFTLKEIIHKIKQHTGNTETNLEFGKLPFRSGQSMHIEGSMTKFESNISPILITDFDHALSTTVSFVRNKLMENK